MSNQAAPGPIGVFDSGYGGLTILHQMRSLLPQYDYLYLGDNARAPYGPRSFDVVYQFTREAVVKLFSMGCHLVILACNTASAKALRTIQQNDLPVLDPTRRVLGVIRPTAECIGSITQTRHVGILATEGTIKSESYVLEIQKLYPDISVSGVACPLWVPLIENNEYDTPGADYFVKKRIDALMRLDPDIDSIILGCTHYPLLLDKILKHTPRRRKDNTTGRVRGREPERLSRAPSRNRRLLHQARFLPLPYNREQGQVRRVGEDIHARTRRRRRYHHPCVVWGFAVVGFYGNNAIGSLLRCKRLPIGV